MTTSFDTESSVQTGGDAKTSLMTPACRPFRLAIVGCGLITENSHLPAALRSPLIELAALVDSDQSRAADLARAYSAKVTITSEIESVLKNIDGVLIATPNHTHAAVAEVVLKASLPVLIEKPMTTDYSDSIRLCDLAQKNNTIIAVGFKTRHHPNVQLMKTLLQEQFFGDIRRFHYEYGSRGGWAPLSGYNLNSRQSGGGVLVVTGTHFLDRMLYWFGDPEIVSYQDDSYGGPEANCVLNVRYDNELGQFEGTIKLSKTAPLRNSFRMETALYSCELADSNTEEIQLISNNNRHLRFTLDNPNARQSRTAVDYFQVQLDDFVTSVRQGGVPVVDGAFGARSVKFVQDLYQQRTALVEPWMWYQNATRESHA